MTQSDLLAKTAVASWKVNLGYLDFRNFKMSDYSDDPDTLVVDRAGRDLYLVEPRSD